MAHKTIALTTELRELRDSTWGTAKTWLGKSSVGDNVLMVILRRRQKCGLLDLMARTLVF